MAHITTKTTLTRFEARADFATLAEAEAFAASFPKSYRVKTGTYLGTGYTGPACFATCHCGLTPHHGNDFNEVGEQRVVRFLDKAEKLGHTIEHK